MNVPVLVIKLHGQRIGCLFKYEQPGMPTILRFAADETYASVPWDEADVLSESMRADDPAQQQSFWLDVTRPEFNTVLGNRGDAQLPPFFQNLLPEGVFRRFVAEEAQIDPLDHMGMIAACGKNMPGAVTAEWEDIPRSTLQRLVTQNQDALEATVWAEPFQDALSISGVQPKIGVNKDLEGRFVGRTSRGDAAIIAKLPSSEYARMPQLESLSMTLARLAGVNVCQFELAPMSALAAPHRYDLGDEVAGQFLAVTRFDRDHDGRVHFEDFAQVLGLPPEQKYAESYVAIAAVLMSLPQGGPAAVHELLRRIEVNELLGNADMHLKNLGLLYRDRRHAELAPAYDITSTLIYNGARGHALVLMPGAQKQHAAPIFNPQRLQAFCNLLGLQVAGCAKVVRDVAAEAAQHWLAPILASGLTPRQKQQLLARLANHPHLVQATRRLRRPDLLEAWSEAARLP
ncbi:type II toxin-antitoxin system HipA family toxin [Hydrogenophaga sp.]|uniref:type II toxin-antitoxin system HipA family toxin n=1 Tax=Hydrogenophaga sp. TaxID=1904254 RepID=UPI0025C3D37B|nr:type II toxin-antitoxin system HipA family toxin [Hydrogenophaga sp.]MBT9465313.1 type II toxin-antitoxin system HipA family toxin [Hydrogenophaga sp.]